MGRIIQLIILMCVLALTVNTQASQSADIVSAAIDSPSVIESESPQSACASCSSSCGTNQKAISLPFKEFPLLLVSISIMVLLLVKRKKIKTLFWSVGLTCFIGLALGVAESQMLSESAVVLCDVDSSIVIHASEPKALTPDIDDEDEFEDEFESVSESDEFISTDEFETISESDEFLTVDDADEFESFSDSDEELSEAGMTAGDKKNLTRTLLALFAAIGAGVVLRFSKSKLIRFFFLLVSLVYLGFYSSGCPCMISSVQNLILFLAGESVSWISLVWIVGLLPITYFFGKIWCGWVCHLGALQEFLYRPRKKAFFSNAKSQKVIKIIRVTALVALIAQLLITRTNLFIKIDPFKVAFNLFSTNLIGYILLIVLLVSSLLMYRPFCKTLCPVGLMLGWVSKIPGASLLKIESSCTSCKRCEKQCDYQAIESNADGIVLDNSECIRCGDCITLCKFNSIKHG